MQVTNVLGLARVCMPFGGYYSLICMEELNEDNSISHRSKGSQQCNTGVTSQNHKYFFLTIFAYINKFLSEDSHEKFAKLFLLQNCKSSFTQERIKQVDEICLLYDAITVISQL